MVTVHSQHFPRAPALRVTAFQTRWTKAEVSRARGPGCLWTGKWGEGASERTREALGILLKLSWFRLTPARSGSPPS